MHTALHAEPINFVLVEVTQKEREPEGTKERRKQPKKKHLIYNNK